MKKTKDELLIMIEDVYDHLDKSCIHDQHYHNLCLLLFSLKNSLKSLTYSQQ